MIKWWQTWTLNGRSQKIWIKPRNREKKETEKKQASKQQVRSNWRRANRKHTTHQTVWRNVMLSATKQIELKNELKLFEIQNGWWLHITMETTDVEMSNTGKLMTLPIDGWRSFNLLSWVTFDSAQSINISCSLSLSLSLLPSSLPLLSSFT